MNGIITPPLKLLRACANGKCVAFVGAGASREAGLPLWADLIRDFIGFANKEGRLEPSCAPESLLRVLDEKGGLEQVAQILKKKVGEALFRTFIGNKFSNFRWQPTALHRAVASGPFRAVFTTNYDCLIEKAYQEAHGRWPTVVTWRNIDDALRMEEENQFFIAKLHGCVSRPESIVLTQPQFADLKDRPGFADFLIAELALRSFLFVGYSISDDDIKQSLEQVAKRFPSRDSSHFSLIRQRDTLAELLQVQSDLFHVVFLPYDKHEQVAPFVMSLTEKAGEVSPVATAMPTDRGLSQLFIAMKWVLDRSVGEGSSRVLICRERGRDEGWRRIAIAIVTGKLNKDSVTDALAMATRYSPEEIIFLLPSNGSEEAQILASQAGAKCLTEYGLMLRAANLKEYADNLSRNLEYKKINEHYVQPAFTVRMENRETVASLDNFVLEWIRDQSRFELWLLGDFGTGKTWFCKHFASLVAKLHLDGELTLPIPVIVPLRRHVGAIDMRNAVIAALSEFGLDLIAGTKTLDWLINQGKLLLIFDGADECPTALYQAQELAGIQCKVIVTCRPHYFETASAYRRALDLERDELRRLDVLELRGLDDRSLAEAISARCPKDWEQKQKALSRWPDLWDMAHRPLFLNMVLETSDQITSKNAPTVTDVYRQYVSRVLTARWGGGRTGAIMARLLRKALEDLAYIGQVTSPRTIEFGGDKLLLAVQDAIHITTSKTVAMKIQADLRTGSLLVRNLNDNYEFGHLSFQEYFAASHFKRLGRKGAKIICDRVADNDWREVCWLYASICEQAEPVLSACLAKKSIHQPQPLFLAAKALEAARDYNAKRASELGDALISLFKNGELTYKDLERIYDAIRRIGEVGRDTLRRHIKTDDPQIRRRCVLAWFESFGREALEQVLPYLDPKKEKDRHVRWHVVEVLAEVAHEVTNVAVLNEFLKHDKDHDPIIRGNALWARSRCSKVDQVRLSTRRKIERVVEEFIPLVNGDFRQIANELRAFVEDKKQSHHPRAHAALLLGRCVAVLGWREEEKAAIGKMLATLLNQDIGWRGYVARALGELEWKGAVPSLCHYLATSKDDEIWLRYAVDAAEHLAERKHVEAIEQARKGIPETYLSLPPRLDALAARLRVAGPEDLKTD